MHAPALTTLPCTGKLVHGLKHLTPLPPRFITRHQHVSTPVDTQSARANGKSRSSHSSGTRVTNAAVAAATAAIAASPSTAFSTVSLMPAWVQPVFIGCTIYTGALFLMMLLAPQWERTKAVISSSWTYVPLALTYTALLVASWQPDTLSLILPGSLQEGLSGGFKPQFMPKLEHISTLFSRPVTFASLWVHIMVINLFSAKTMFTEGLKTGTPTFHSVLISAICGPLGLLSHLLTKGLYNVITSATGSDPRKAAEEITLSSGDGTITIMPYTSA